ncbi:exo-alpha-sialidase [Flavisolibacter nicotianae]|uniref:exo-alpha-sialidase n=1 Tax=Flavisolibacter nicotianae TaxID=2364882 RepID=UPI000EB2EB51|nr:exo-alpha-sialidase [Flavisolibacter nicotianae]
MNKFFSIAFLISSFSVCAQDTVRYMGHTLVNIDYHHGQLSPAVGVHNIQVFRANREHPEWAGGINWTYNHQPMLVYWNNQFFLHFLSDPVGEHVPPGQTFLLTSKDGYQWSKPVVVFPPVKIPDGTTKEGRTEVAKDLLSVNHQRMGFYVSKKTNRLLTLAYYGVVLGPGDDPNDGRGMGRSVREIYKNGSFGPIYFIRYNKGWNEKNTAYPFYTKSKDKGFVDACNELLATPLLMQQWVEEADRDDPLIPLKKDYKAFSYYHLPDGRVVGLWKNALTSVSKDEGKTWLYNPLRAPQFVNSNAKIWGQRTSDSKYVTIYNPSEFRWPLALSVSNDGLHYNNLLLVNGEITSMRYGGAYKSYGPQYVRGIVEGNGTPPDGNIWVTYSMNKEDIWVATIPVPVQDNVTAHANEVFNDMPDGKELAQWNYNSGLWTPVSIEKTGSGAKALTLQDWDPFDFAKAERVVPSSKRIVTEFTIIPRQSNNGWLDIEFLDSKGTPGVRLSFDSTGNVITKAGYRNRKLFSYAAGETYKIRVELNTATRFYNVMVNGKALSPQLFFAPLASIDRVAFRTGHLRRFPDADTPTDQDFDLPNAGSQDKKATYYITAFKTENK